MNAPDIRVEKGHAEPEEVAAITAILLARAAARPSEPTRLSHASGMPSSA
ncbi:acyl-CoA carboxylase epsilon subunit [Streptomyces sp. IBSBF 2806]